MGSIYSDVADAARRAFLGVTRGTLTKSDDKKLLQESKVKSLYGDDWEGVEHALPYGFHAVPLPPSKDQNGKEQHAEVFIAQLNGTRSHPVILAIADRRNRPNRWEDGEVGIHDHQQQVVKIGNTKIQIGSYDERDLQNRQQGDSGGSDRKSSKLPIEIHTGDSTHVVAKDKITDTVKKTTRTLKDGTHELKVGDDCYVKVEGDKVTVCKGDMKVIVSASRVDLGGEGGSAVVTVAGPSEKVFSIL